jgi:hypothetical protein
LSERESEEKASKQLKGLKANMRERMDTTTPERNEYEHRYKDNQVEGVLRDPIEKEKGLWDRSVDPADNRVNGEPSYREDQVALMWYTGTFKDGASELSVERIQVDHKTGIPYIGDPENSLPINVRPRRDYLGASWLYTKINLSRRPSHQIYAPREYLAPSTCRWRSWSRYPMLTRTAA